MMKKSFFLAGIALVCLLVAFTSCDNDSDRPAKMRWKSVNGQVTNNISSFEYEVGSEGGEYDFVCTNYNMFTLVQIVDLYKNATSDNSDSIDYYTFPQNDSLQNVAEKTGVIKVFPKMAEVTAKASMLNVKINPNTSGKQRIIDIGVMAVNTGTTFRFIQDYK